MRFGKARLKNYVFRLALLSPFTTFAADLKRRKDDGISLHTLEPRPGIVPPRRFYSPMVQRAVDDCHSNRQSGSLPFVQAKGTSAGYFPDAVYL